MILLAFDTSLAACSAAVAIDGRVVSGRFIAMERGHAEALAPMLREAMGEAGVGFAQLGRIAVTLGPGTFTGVRIGLAMARGLSLALGIPAVGLTTLEAIACNAGSPVIVANDARRGEIHFGLPQQPPRLLALTAAVDLLPTGPLRIIGTAADALIAAAGRGDLKRDAGGDLPVAANFIALAAAREPEAKPPEPLYLRAPDAKPQALPVRPVLASEAPILAAIHAECFDEPWDATALARLMAMPGAVTLVAMEGQEPTGFILMRRAADEAEIVIVATRPSVRRRGIASRLIAAATASLSGISRIFIEVNDANSAARGLYAKLGFVPAGERKSYYRHTDGSRGDAVVMRKDIAA